MLFRIAVIVLVACLVFGIAHVTGFLHDGWSFIDGLARSDPQPLPNVGVHAASVHAALVHGVHIDTVHIDTVHIDTVHIDTVHGVRIPRVSLTQVFG